MILRTPSRLGAFASVQAKLGLLGCALVVVGMWYLSAPAPNLLQVTAIEDGVKLSWHAEPDAFYSLGYAPTPDGPWQEFWRGCVAEGAEIGTAVHPSMSNVVLSAFPPTSDSNSLWGCGLTWSNPPMTGRELEIYITLSNPQGYFHLWKRTVGAPVAIPTLNISREDAQ